MADLAHAFAKNGIGVGRAPIDYQDYHMALLMPTFREKQSAVKELAMNQSDTNRRAPVDQISAEIQTLLL